ncbi:hypothetical protein GQX74_005820 [Glossina fuscipes]|nr:hypothetical protein GQX74_005820 [Glossina fuscipes]
MQLCLQNSEKNFGVKRSDFILVEPIEEGDKVKAEICKFLTAEQIRQFIKTGIWSVYFKRDDNEWTLRNNISNLSNKL